MNAISPLKTGLALGVSMGLFHACWAALVALGWAQPVIDFILGLHFIEPFMRLKPFDLIVAAELVGVTGALGFLAGAVLALLWNMMHPGRAA